VTPSAPARVAEVSPHLSIVDLVADVGDGQSEDNQQHKGTRATHDYQIQSVDSSPALPADWRRVNRHKAKRMSGIRQ